MKDMVTLLQSVITSIALPFILELLIQTSWPVKLKYVVSVCFSAVCSFLLAYYNNQIALSNIPETILLTLLLTEANYRLWFKCSAIQTWITIGKNESK